MIRASNQTAGPFGAVKNAIGGIAKAAVVAGAAAAASMVGLVAATVGAASDLNETMNKVDVVFGASAAAMKAWGKTAAETMGMSTREALDASANFGTMFRTMGLGEAQTVDMSQSLVRLAGDLASFYNLDPENTLEKLRSGLVGEAEPLRTLGVLLTEDAVKAKGLAMGLGKATGALSEGEKAQARYALILEQTQLVQGDYIKTSDSLANTQRRLKKQFENIRAAIGQAFLPAMQEATGALSAFLTRASESGAIDRFAARLADLVTKGIDVAIDAFGRLRDIYLTVKGVFAGEWVSSDKIDPITRGFGDMAAAVRDMLPTIRDIAGAIKNELAEALQRLNDLSPETKDNLTKVGVGVAGLAVANQVAPGVLSLAGALANAAVQIVAIGGVNWWDLLGAAALIAAAGGVYAYSQNWLGLQDKLKPVFDWLGSRMGELLNPPAATGHDMPDTWVDTLKVTLSGVTKDVETFWDTYTAHGNDNPFAGQVEAVTSFADSIRDALGPVLDVVGGKVGQYLGNLKKFAVEVAPEFVAAAQSIGEKILWLWNTIIEPTFSTIVTFIQSHSDLILQLFGGIWKVIEGIITIALTVIKGIIMIALNLIQGDWTGAWNAMTDMLGGIWDGIKLIIQGAVDFITGWLALAWEAIKATASRAWEGITTVIGDAWNALKDWLGGKVEDLKTLLSDTWNAIKQTASDAWEGLKTAVTTKVDDLVTFMAGLPQRCSDALGDLGSLLWNAGTALIQGLIDGINSKIADLQALFGRVTSLIPSWKGPADKDRWLLFGAGQAIIAGLVDGIGSGLPSVRHALDEVTSAVAAWQPPGMARLFEGEPKSWQPPGMARLFETPGPATPTVAPWAGQTGVPSWATLKPLPAPSVTAPAAGGTDTPACTPAGTLNVVIELNVHVDAETADPDGLANDLAPRMGALLLPLFKQEVAVWLGTRASVNMRTA